VPIACLLLLVMTCNFTSILHMLSVRDDTVSIEHFCGKQQREFMVEEEHTCSSVHTHMPTGDGDKLVCVC
jgi:hypothetical protein